MPRIFTYNSFCNNGEKVRKYADKHAPVVHCASMAQRGRVFPVAVRIGSAEKHPNTSDHHFCYIQLWNLETLVGEYRFDHKNFGAAPLQIEAHFSMVPALSMRLTAMAYCNKHGLWQSGEVFVKITD